MEMRVAVKGSSDGAVTLELHVHGHGVVLTFLGAGRARALAEALPEETSVNHVRPEVAGNLRYGIPCVGPISRTQVGTAEESVVREALRLIAVELLNAAAESPLDAYRAPGWAQSASEILQGLAYWPRESREGCPYRAAGGWVPLAGCSRQQAYSEGWDLGYAYLAREHGWANDRPGRAAVCGEFRPGTLHLRGWREALSPNDKRCA